MSEYGKGYIAKSALLDAVEWDNDLEKWVIWDDDLQSLMTEKNDVVEVVRCKDCKHRFVDPITLSLTSNPENAAICDIGIGPAVSDFYCRRGKRRGGDQQCK